MTEDAPEKQSFHVLAGEPVPVTTLEGVFQIVVELGLVVSQGYRCVLYEWGELKDVWSWRPAAGASLGEKIDVSRAAKSLIAKAGVTGEASLHRLTTSPTHSMVKYDIEAVAVFPFSIKSGPDERRFVLYLDVLSGESLDDHRVKKLGQMLRGLLSLGGSAIGALLAVEADRARRQRNDLGLSGDYSEIVGRSEAIRRVLSIVDRIAETDFPVLVLGETGTGKELIARGLHRNSRRREAAFEALNCAMLPEKLAESMLFGHRKGAFTDAQADHRGLFELASGGTLFLDEIGELSPEHQAKLLRVLDEGVVRPIGAEKDLKVDVRVVSATNRDLRELVEKGQFRSDLYHRISSVAVELPPLRERREDIPELVRHFLQGKQSPITPAALARLTAAPWEGNIRELKSKVGVLRELAVGGKIELDTLDFVRLGGEPAPTSWDAAWRQTERDFLVRLIAESDGTSAEEVAKLMGKSRSWLYEKAKEHGIKIKELLRAKGERKS